MVPWARCFRSSISSLTRVNSAAAGAEVTRADLAYDCPVRVAACLLGETANRSGNRGNAQLLGGQLEIPTAQGQTAISRFSSKISSPVGEVLAARRDSCSQDRSLWNRKQIAEGVALLEKALKSRRFGSYTLQAAIAAVHAEAKSVAVTDWRQILALYDRLLRIQPSPVVQLNRAVAIAMCDGPEAGLTHIDAVLEHGELANYYLAHSARADMYRRLGRTAEARASYEKALALTQQEPERQFLQERIRQLK